LNICDAYRADLNSARVNPWSKKMESKVGIISHRPCKTKLSLWDIGTKKKHKKKP
jgi:hypothetical protein